MHHGVITIEAGIVGPVTANLDPLLVEVAPTAVAVTHTMKMTAAIIKIDKEVLDIMLLSTEIRETGGNGHGVNL